MRATLAALGFTLILSATASAQVSALRVSLDASRSPGDAEMRAEFAVKAFARNFADLTRAARTSLATAHRYRNDIPLMLPAVVHFTRNGADIPAAPPSGRAPGQPLHLVFDTTGAGAFPQSYKDLLQSVFDSAKPTMDLIFGQPAVGGDVHVLNFDATIGDRDAVAGGFFLPNNGSGQAEIRFAVYSNQEAAAVNFIHTLLLAYLGPDQYSFDAFNEGLVRAATMFTARSAGALPSGLDPDLVDAVLSNTYDVGGLYDWYNQRALGGPTFIAPNLRSVPLPIGGSVGGLYLLRYRMSGEAWMKVLAQYPTFIAHMNQAVETTPSLAGNVPGLIAEGQTILDSLGGANSTVEGLSFAEWYRRQFILETSITEGLKLLVEPVPITTGLQTGDFGVFLVQANWFQTNSGGNEILLSGTSFPIFWEGDPVFNRVFPSSQEDRMDIAGAYGSVAPNMPDLHSGQPYRVDVDIPVLDQVQRVYLPAGAIATATSASESNFYGTVEGVADTSLPMKVRLTIGATNIDTPILNGAFGAVVGNTNFLGTASVLLTLIQTTGSGDVTLFTRRVNKSPGPLAVDLQVNSEGTFSFPGGLPKGINAMGFPIDPFNSFIPSFLNVAPSQVLVARFNSSKDAYDFYPDIEPFKVGHGYFVHRDAAIANFTVGGRFYNHISGSVALRPGWNLVSSPLMESVATNNILVVHAADSPSPYADAVGTLIGTTYFSFTPGSADAASGAPETGSFTAVGGTTPTFDPGKAYFVRVLAPEGVTLLFQPAQTQLQANRAVASVTQRALPTALLRLDVAGDGSLVHALVGQSKTATNGFDPKEDSGIPRGIGGLQAVIEGAQDMYQDMRPAGVSGWYTVRLEGLKPGVKYTLGFHLDAGKLPYFGLQTQAGGRYQTMTASDHYTFTATASTQRVGIWLPGGFR